MKTTMEENKCFTTPASLDKRHLDSGNGVLVLHVLTECMCVVLICGIWFVLNYFSIYWTADEETDRKQREREGWDN